MYVELLYILGCAKSNLGLKDATNLCTQYPFQPLLIKILMSVKKGCSHYYRLLRKVKNLSTSLSSREEKWNEELGLTLSPRFWNSTYKLTSDIKNDNRLKWLQYQIQRNSLYTNYRVHKYNTQVSPYCTFCLQESETCTNFESISHLFYGCKFVVKLWEAVGNWLKPFGVTISLDIKSLLFGCHDQPVTSISNYVILTVKYYVWISKYKNNELNF